jgi:hypothetical protein
MWGLKNVCKITCVYILAKFQTIRDKQTKENVPLVTALCFFPEPFYFETILPMVYNLESFSFQHYSCIIFSSKTKLVEGSMWGLYN